MRFINASLTLHIYLYLKLYTISTPLCRIIYNGNRLINHLYTTYIPLYTSYIHRYTLYIPSTYRRSQGFPHRRPEGCMVYMVIRAIRVIGLLGAVMAIGDLKGVWCIWLGGIELSSSRLWPSEA